MISINNNVPLHWINVLIILKGDKEIVLLNNAFNDDTSYYSRFFEVTDSIGSRSIWLSAIVSIAGAKKVYPQRDAS